MIDHYQTLDVPRDATPDDLKKAYRKKAMKHHPDKKGGNVKKFQALSLAYETLSDPKARERYDRTGKDGSITDVEREARNLLCKEFGALLDTMQERIFKIDTFARMAKSLASHAKVEEGKITRCQKDAAFFKRVKDRISRQSDATPPMFELMIENMVRAAQDKIEFATTNIEIIEKAQSLLADFQWRADAEDMTVTTISPLSRHVFDCFRDVG